MVALLLLWAAPANAFTKQTGTRTMADGTTIAYDLYQAAEVFETWTDLYSALWPQDVAKSGIVLGFAKSVEARSPLIASLENDAVHSTNLATIKALAAV